MGKLENLKLQWLSDPVWDIEYTDGFEEHKEELKAFRLEKEKEWELKNKTRVIDEAMKLGCSPQLLSYLKNLEHRIAELENQ